MIIEPQARRGLTPMQQGALDRASILGHEVAGFLGLGARVGMDGFRVRATGGSTSAYNSVSGTGMIGMSSPQCQGVDGDLGIIETTLHEGTHHLVRNQVGWPGLPAMGQPGMIGEGLAQVIAGATLARAGRNPRERDYGWRTLDPHGQQARIGRALVPLSLTMDELRTRGPLPNDAGGVHVHGGIIQHAHWLLAKSIGLDDMLRITGDALRGELHRMSRIRGWAAGMLEMAELRFGAGSAQATAVRDAWAGVHLVLPA
ncbi:MAG: Thermolysin metallopeptidase alpha-helical domain [Thermoleophilia bacterium]|nr:Thermolysin metallopeptidase alpha-helical domain [Thermoleophilia bacterium]